MDAATTKALQEAREARPILLSKAEALDFAARQLDRMAADLDMAELMLSVLGGGESNDDLNGKIVELRKAMPEPKLQAAAIREAAGTIRELMIEERIRAARIAATRGIG